MGSCVTMMVFSSHDHPFLCENTQQTAGRDTGVLGGGNDSNEVTSYRTDLPLLAQNHFDGIGGHDDVDLLFLDILQLEFVLQRSERRC